MESRIATLKDVFEAQREEEQLLTWRFPWFNVVYNYIVAGVVFALIVSLTVWGLNVRTERKAEAMTAQAMAAWQSEQDAALEAEAAELAAVRTSQEYAMEQEATALAKAFYGIRLFVDKYHYSEADYRTYARCIFNRTEKGSGDLVSVVSTPEQFVGYYDNNPVLAEDYDLAMRFVKEWHEESIKPCDISYQFAELTPNGIWLKADLHADGYARRWRAA